MKVLFSRLKVVSINLAVLAGLFLIIEVGFRYFYKGASTRADQYAIWLTFQPYVMTSNPQTHYSKWWNEFSNSYFDVDVVSNNYGFSTRGNFNLTRTYQKALNEKVVLFTGG